MRRLESLGAMRERYITARNSLLAVIALAPVMLGLPSIFSNSERNSTHSTKQAGPTTTVTHPPFVPRDEVRLVVSVR